MVKKSNKKFKRIQDIFPDTKGNKIDAYTDPSRIFLKKPRLIAGCVKHYLKEMGATDDDIICVSLEIVRGSPIEWMRKRACRDYKVK